MIQGLIEEFINSISSRSALYWLNAAVEGLGFHSL